MSRENLTKIGLVVLGISAVALLALILFATSSQPPQEVNKVEKIGEDNKQIERTAPSGLQELEMINEEDPNWRGPNTQVSLEIQDKLPERLMIFKQAGSNNTVSRDRANEIASEFGFVDLPTNLPGSGGYSLIWSEKGRALTVEPSSKTVAYDNSAFNRDPNNFNIKEFGSESEPQEMAEGYLRQYGLLSPYLDLENVSVSFTPFGELHVDETSEPGKKQLAVVDYRFRLNSHQLLVGGLFSTRVVVSSTGVLVSLKTRIYNVVWEDYKEFDLLSLAEAKRIVEQGGGMMVSNTNAYSTSLTLESYKLDTVSLAYYGKNEEEIYSHPVYVFSGKGILGSGEESLVTVYVPALAY